MTTRYKVVTEGKLRDGVAPEQFISAFSKTFKVAEEQARKLLASGRTVTLKDDLDQDTAEKFRRVLADQMGLEVRVEAKPALSLMPADGLSPEAQTESAASPDASTPAASASAAPDATVRCPKCGSDRVSGDDCLACGVIISRYRARQAQAAESQADAAGWNPYQSTATEDAQDDGPASMRTVDAGEGWQWIVGGWRLFVRNPFAWIGALVIWYLIMFIAGLIPFVGSLAINILSPVFLAGIMIGANEQHEGGNFTVGHLFQGFSTEFNKLALAGLLYLAATVVIVIVGAILFMLTGLGAFMHQAGSMAADGGPSIIMILILFIVVFTAMAVLATAFYYLPLLIVFDGLGPVEAMTRSFAACWKNWLPFLVYGLIIIGLSVLAVIPLGLGFFVLAPVIVASIYVSYRDIFHNGD